MRKLSPADLPGTRFGGPRTTKAMIHATWHLTTAAFLTVGGALAAAGTVLDGDAARGAAWVATCAATAFAAVVVGLGAAEASPGAALRHPGPWVLSATAAFAWWGALSLS